MTEATWRAGTVAEKPVSATLYPPDQPIREADLCRLLAISSKTLRRRGIKSVKMGRDRVYLWRWVVDYLEKAAA